MFLRKTQEGVRIIYMLLIAEIKKQLYLKKLEYKDIAKMTGYKTSTISAFMCGARQNETVAKSIASALGIEY